MKIFGNRRDSFTYHSDTQLKETLLADKAEAFNYVFDRYGPLLKKNIGTAFQINPEDAEKTFKKRCNELHGYLLANNCAKLKLFDPDSSSFEIWLAVTSRSFFKKAFCEENTALAEKYRSGDPAMTFQRYKTDFEHAIRLSGEMKNDVIEENAKDLAQSIYEHLFKDNCRRLNTYDPSQKAFDVWFKTVLRNFSIDQYKKTQKKEEKVIDSGGFVRIDNETSPIWENSIINTDDEEKKELVQTLRELLDTLEPPRYREVLIALFYDGEKKEVIAEQLHVSMDNFYNITSRALARFKTLCKEHGLI